MDQIDIEEPGDEWESDFYDDSDDRPGIGAQESLVDRCLFGAECIAVDPFHGPAECWTAEMVEAYEADLAYRDLGAGDA